MHIKPYDLKIVNTPKTADYEVILFVDFDNEDGYDCVGYKCYPKSKHNKFPEVNSISYSGVCGDVNTLQLTDKNSKILFETLFYFFIFLYIIFCIVT